MTSPEIESPKVFISYTHDSPEHVDRVLKLADRLRDEGVDCHLDQYETSPPEGWPRWMDRQIEWADYVLVVCTETYQKRFKGTGETGKGLGAKWEGAIITQELYDAEANNTKFIPLLFSPEDLNNRPNLLRGATYYDISSEEGYEELYRRLTKQNVLLSISKQWKEKSESLSYFLLSEQSPLLTSGLLISSRTILNYFAP
jgi:hypothetical protein